MLNADDIKNIKLDFVKNNLVINFEGDANKTLTVQAAPTGLSFYDKAQASIEFKSGSEAQGSINLKNSSLTDSLLLTLKGMYYSLQQKICLIEKGDGVELESLVFHINENLMSHVQRSESTFYNQLKENGFVSEDDLSATKNL